MKSKTKRNILNKVKGRNKRIMVVVRRPGKAAEHRVCLELFAPLFLSRGKSGKSTQKVIVFTKDK